MVADLRLSDCENPEPKQPGQNQVDGHEIIQNTWKHQDEQAKNDRERGAKVGCGDDHRTLLFSGVKRAWIAVYVPVPCRAG
jgi:hypothetical protein